MKSDLNSFTAQLRALIGNPPVEASNFHFGELALELFALQFAANPAYRKICEARRTTPMTISDWTQIPAVPTAAFKELELTCLPPAERTHVFHSSGTSGQHPSRHFHNSESLAIYEASVWPWFEQCVIHSLKSQAPGFNLLILTPPPAQAPHSSLVHMFETVRQKMDADKTAFKGRAHGGNDWTLDFDFVVPMLHQASKGTDPLLLIGTAFSFVHLLDHLREHGVRYRLPHGSRVMETGGYKGRSREMLKAELHGLITRQLGVPPPHIVCEYGMSELSSQAYDTPTESPRAFRFPPWARVQIISPETGREVADCETGLLRVFDLANVFSVMAVQTEDLAVRHGDGFELLGRAVAAEPRGCSLMTA